MDVEKAAYDLQQKYSKRMEKKMQGKPQAVKIIMSRTFSSAIMILQTIADIPFEKLAFSIYDFCVDYNLKKSLDFLMQNLNWLALTKKNLSLICTLSTTKYQTRLEKKTSIRNLLNTLAW
jgi:hypothetical protein